MDGQVIYYLNTNLMIWKKLSVYLANKYFFFPQSKYMHYEEDYKINIFF